MRWRSIAALAAALCVTPVAARADSFDPISYGLHVGTLGDGISLERPLLFDLSARIETNWLSTTTHPVYGGNPWASTLHEENALVAMDWRPSAGRWRLSAGFVLGGDHVDEVAQSVNGNYLINGNTYAASQAGVVSARISYSEPALYLGFGAGTGILKGLTIGFDAGIVLRNGTLTTMATGPLAGNAQFRADLAATAGQFRTRFVQPVIDVGIAYRP